MQFGYHDADHRMRTARNHRRLAWRAVPHAQQGPSTQPHSSPGGPTALDTRPRPIPPAPRRFPAPLLVLFNGAGIAPASRLRRLHARQGAQGSISFDGVWITITKKEVDKTAREFRLRAKDVTGTRLKPATRLFRTTSSSSCPAHPRPKKPGASSPADAPVLRSPQPIHPTRSNDAAATLITVIE